MLQKNEHQNFSNKIILLVGMGWVGSLVEWTVGWMTIPCEVVSAVPPAKASKSTFRNKAQYLGRV